MYLKNEVAYQDREGTCRIGETPVALAESYSENECDAIYVALLSENDAEHEKDLDVLREICQNTAVPVIGSGHIFRMEDVKKTVICRLPAGDAGLCRSGAAGADKRGLPEIWQRKNRSGRCRYFASGTGKGAAKGIYLQRIFCSVRCNGGGCADVSGSGGNLFCRRFPWKSSSRYFPMPISAVFPVSWSMKT